MRNYKAEAIILSRKNSGEADKVVTLFTKQYGKKVVLAKGIRRITSRRAPHLEPFAHCLLILNPGRTFDYITEAQTLQAFPHIRKKLERVGFAYIALELISRLTAEGQEAWPLFILLTSFLVKLNDPLTSRLSAQEELIQFKQKLLGELGFIEREKIYTEVDLDTTIELILESRVKSPDLLTSIQEAV